MHRIALSLLGGLLAAAVLTAAPAPFPDASKAWLAGWDKPVDAVGDCKFDRKGDKLTIAVPGKGHDLDVRRGRLDAPHLLRDAEGDFVVQVRVGGLSGTDGDGCRRAGILLRGGEADPVVRMQFAAAGPRRRCNVLVEISQKDGGPAFRGGTYDGPLLGVPGWVRIERRGKVGKAAFSEDGKKWTSFNVPLAIGLPRKMKVGVVAESTAAGAFKVVFDEFKLTKPSK